MNVRVVFNTTAYKFVCSTVTVQRCVQSYQHGMVTRLSTRMRRVGSHVLRAASCDTHVVVSTTKEWPPPWAEPKTPFDIGLLTWTPTTRRRTVATDNGFLHLYRVLVGCLSRVYKLACSTSVAVSCGERPTPTLRSLYRMRQKKVIL